MLGLCLQFTAHCVTRCVVMHNPNLYTTDTRWRSWLRHCCTNRKVAGSFTDDVIGIFH